jgi:hypothetical protein
MKLSLLLESRVTRRLGKNAQNLEKVAKTVAKPKLLKKSTLKLNLKVQSIFIKPLLKTKTSYNKPDFEIAYLRKIVKNLLSQKVAQKVINFLGLHHVFKKS